MNAPDDDNQPPNAEATGIGAQCFRRRPTLLEPLLVFRPQISVYAGPFRATHRQNGMKHCLILAMPSRRRSPRKLLAPTTKTRGNRDRASHCEIREFTLNDTGRLNVDAATNGGIRVTGADRSNVLVRARVQTSAHAGRGKGLAHKFTSRPLRDGSGRSDPRIFMIADWA